jgi:sirohydrochlorin ferrochelatase
MVFKSMKTAVLIVAHGSRNPAAEKEFLQIVEQLRQTLTYPILQYAWLEMSQPDIVTGLDLCKEQGAEKIVLMPYFLNLGNHVIKDIPAIVEAWQKSNPLIEVMVARHLGISDLLLELVQVRVKEIENQRNTDEHNHKDEG